MRNILYILLFLLLIPINVIAKDRLNDLSLKGKASLHYFIWHIYDIYLYTNNGFSFENTFHLIIEYKRNLYGNKIADRSAEEIRHLGFRDEIKLAKWHAQMEDIFPDVKNGDRLTGIYQPDSYTLFLKNGEEIGRINDIEFGRWFFGIWLNERTREPEVRKLLIGNNNE